MVEGNAAQGTVVVRAGTDEKITLGPLSTMTVKRDARAMASSKKASECRFSESIDIQIEGHELGEVSVKSNMVQTAGF